MWYMGKDTSPSFKDWVPFNGWTKPTMKVGDVSSPSNPCKAEYYLQYTEGIVH